jgi:hypothetical protein
MEQVAQAVPADVQWLTRAAEAFEKQLEIEWSAPASAADDSAGKLALARAIAGPLAQDSEQGLVRLVSERALKRYSALHVATRVAQVDEARERAAAALQAVVRTGQAVMAQARAHLWLPPSWRDAIAALHQDNAQGLGALLARLDDAREGFATLPVDRRAGWRRTQARVAGRLTGVDRPWSRPRHPFPPAQAIRPPPSTPPFTPWRNCRANSGCRPRSAAAGPRQRGWAA